MSNIDDPAGDPSDAAMLRSTIADVVAAALIALQGECVDDADRIDRIRAVDRAVAAPAASQVCDSAEFYLSQMQEQERLGVPLRRRGRGIADQIGLATKRSRSRRPGGWLRHVRWWLTCPTPLRCWPRAECASWVPRSRYGRQLSECRGPSADRSGARRGRRRHVDRADRAGDPASRAGTRRGRGGQTDRPCTQDRHVTIWPQADCMARVSALMPVEQGVAV